MLAKVRKAETLISRFLHPEGHEDGLLRSMLEWGMVKEAAPITLDDPTNEVLMGRLIKSFENERWETNQIWVNDKDEFLVWLDSPSKMKSIDYYSQKKKTSQTVEVAFRDGAYGRFIFRQTSNRNGINNSIEIEPFADSDSRFGYGVHYQPGGEMGPLRNIKGLPKKIDMDATVKAFLEQVIEGKFGRPVLIRPW